jgi:hypothetical protein
MVRCSEQVFKSFGGDVGGFENVFDSTGFDDDMHLWQLGHAPTSTVLNFLRRFKTSMLSR